MSQAPNAMTGATDTAHPKEKSPCAIATSDADSDELAAPAVPEGGSPDGGEQAEEAAGPSGPAPLWRITVGVVCADLGQIPGRTAGISTDPPVDALAVGHYLGVRPQYAEASLDKAISDKLGGKVTKEGEPLVKADYLLTQLTERGVIRGELAELFFLPDPRTDESLRGPDSGSGGTDRVIAIAGMGMPGRFGVPELVVLARELSWALGRLGRRHLASVLIGAGVGNLPIRAAIGAWLRGLADTATGSPLDDRRLLHRITFVEDSPENTLKIDKAIHQELEYLKRWKEQLPKEQGAKYPAEEERVEFDHDALSEARKLELAAEAAHRSQQRLAAEICSESTPPDEDEPIPTRLTVVEEGKAYRFGAITKDASIPEREVPLDRDLVREGNDELVVPINTTAIGEDRNWQPAIMEALGQQCEQGQFMGHLLLPDDLCHHLSSREPLVLLLDSTTARIHWEMVAPPERAKPWLNGQPVPSSFKDQFLGLSRGLTRQLRTTFAPPPEPPPPPRRILRVLVVADPTSMDKPLYNAAKEGDEVKELFEAFNAYRGPTSQHLIEVTLLKGTVQAKRTTVLRHLMVKGPFDVLHFTGHCRYDKNNRDASGWLFANGQYITARELSRIDRIPKFVFSNACESGVTPDRARERSAGMAPSFAESFFARGVANFVCTAWPVDDGAGRKFVRELYAALLGLEVTGQKAGGSEYVYAPCDPQPMHEAMHQARLRIAETPGGVVTWGAYQHYGNPFFRFFDPG
ncbi:MAG: CHAT domain-containing protein, partial [Planctomycetaceae bacterium]